MTGSGFSLNRLRIPSSPQPVTAPASPTSKSSVRTGYRRENDRSRANHDEGPARPVEPPEICGGRFVGAVIDMLLVLAWSGRFRQTFPDPRPRANDLTSRPHSSVMPSSVSSPNSAAGKRSAAGASPARRHRRWLLAAALVGMTLGSLGVLILLGLTLLDVQFAGVLLLILSVTLLVVSLRLKGWRALPWFVAIAAVYGGGGFAVVFDPLLEADYTGFIVAAVLLAAGFARLAIARRVGGGGRRWLMGTGIAAMLLGVMLISGDRLHLFWVALFLSLEMILQGLSCLVLGATAREQSEPFPA